MADEPKPIVDFASFRAARLRCEEVQPEKSRPLGTEDTGFIREVRGHARCVVCQHEWQASIMMDYENSMQLASLECEKCGAHRGQFDWPIDLPETSQVWTCRCTSQLFRMTLAGTFCVGCGRHQVFS